MRLKYRLKSGKTHEIQLDPASALAPESFVMTYEQDGKDAPRVQTHVTWTVSAVTPPGIEKWQFEGHAWAFEFPSDMIDHLIAALQHAKARPLLTTDPEVSHA